jgi:prepilin-type N-terminal cleavage/methylation domain-containing protein
VLNPNQQTGFTLIEMLTVIAVMGILAAIAAPSFGNFVKDNQLASTLSQLTNDLNRARTEAIKRNTWMLVCVRNTAGTDCDTATNWQNGWLTCPASSSGAVVCDATPLSQHAAISSGMTLTGSAAVIRFNPNGTQGAGGSATLTLCCKSDGESRVANIAATGNVSR